MKFNKSGEQPQAQKKHNFRFDEEGHIIVQNPSAYWIPNITTKQTIGGTEYTVVAELVGDEPPKSSKEYSRMIKNYRFKVLNFERRYAMIEMLNSTLTVAMQAGFAAARLPSTKTTVSVVSQAKPRVHNETEETWQPTKLRLYIADYPKRMHWRARVAL